MLSTFFKIPFDEMFGHDVHNIGDQSTHPEHVLGYSDQERLQLFMSVTIFKHGGHMISQQALIESKISKSRLFLHL